jgi:hypothetical protein
MPAMEGDGDRPFAQLFLKADDLFGFIWHREGLHGIAILRRTIADAALLQASQQQITAAANIGLATRQRVRHRPDKRTKSTRFAERFSH